MPANFSGKWTSGKSENWDKLLGKFGVPLDKIPADIQVTENITQSGDAITIKTSNNKDSNVTEVTINVGSNHKAQMAPGVEQEFTTAWEGDKLVLKQVGGGGQITREIAGGQMVLTLDAGDVVAKTFYDKA